MPITQAEQYLVELINRARLDPDAEAKRYGLSDLNSGLSSGTISGNPVQALAANALLNHAAQSHSEWMLKADIFSHTGQGESSPKERMLDAHYTLEGAWRTGENIAWSGTTGRINLQDAIAQHHEGLFLSTGHRRNLLQEDFREIGVAQVEGQFTSGRTYNASMLTENFAKSGSNVFLTGVVYDDKDNDDFFSIGEGRSGATFSIGNSQTQSLAAGGYALEVKPGDKTVSVNYGNVNATVLIDLSDQNAKLDLVDGDTLFSAADITLVSGITKAGLLSASNLNLAGSNVGDDLTGNKGLNVLSGKAGNDTIDGGAGNDTLYGGSGNDSLMASSGNDEAFGGAGKDILNGGTGFDLLGGGANNDTIFGGTNDDTLWGGSSHDFIYGGLDDDLLGGGAGKDRIWGDEGNDTLYGGGGRDTVYGGDGSDFVGGGRGDDVVKGGSGDDVLAGGGQADYLAGEQGNDTLNGGFGNDTLSGGADDDVLNGNFGADVLTGGLGADIFVFDVAGAKTVTDFDGSEGDMLQIDNALWGGANLTAAQVVAQYADDSSGTVIFDFGGGNTITLTGVSSTSGLAGDLLVI